MLCILEAGRDTLCEESSKITAISNWSYCHVSEFPGDSGPGWLHYAAGHQGTADHAFSGGCLVPPQHPARKPLAQD